MSTAKAFTWVVSFTVAPLWVQDGFTISHERALSMLARAVGPASADEIQARVIEAPSPLQVARMQGYTKNDYRSGAVVRDIMENTAGAGAVRAALIKARTLLDSVAFVSREGDTLETLAAIDTALQAIDTRQGQPVDIED